MNSPRVSPRAWNYQLAVYDFFSKIIDITHITLKFEKSTENRIYFCVGNLFPKLYGTNCLIHVFVRKRDLSVEIYDEKTGKIITKKMIQHIIKEADIN